MEKRKGKEKRCYYVRMREVVEKATKCVTAIIRIFNLGSLLASSPLSCFLNRIPLHAIINAIALRKWGLIAKNVTFLQKASIRLPGKESDEKERRKSKG